MYRNIVRILYVKFHFRTMYNPNSFFDTYSKKSGQKLLQLLFKTIHQRGIGPTYELYGSSRSAAAVHLFSNYMHFFVTFLGWVIMPHSQATSTNHGGRRTLIFHLRGGDVTTSPPLPIPPIAVTSLNALR